MGRLRILNIFVEDYEVFGIIFLIYVCALLTHHLQHCVANIRCFFYTTKIFSIKIVCENIYLTFVSFLWCVYINVYMRAYIVCCFDNVHCLLSYYN